MKRRRQKAEFAEETRVHVLYSAVWKRRRIWAERKVLRFDRKYERMRAEGQARLGGSEKRILKCWRGNLRATKWKWS